MTDLSNERLEKIASWSETYGAEHNVMIPAAEAEELARLELQRRKAAEKPVAWTDEQELRDVEQRGCGYLFTVNPITPNADMRRVIPLFKQQPLTSAEREELQRHREVADKPFHNWQDEFAGACRTLAAITELLDIPADDVNGEPSQIFDAIEALKSRLAAYDRAAKEPVAWGAPKTVHQLIRQLQTFNMDTEITAVLRMKEYDGKFSNKIRQCPLSISYERYDGPWMIPFKDTSHGRIALTFWSKPDERPDAERGECLTAPPLPVVPDEAGLLPCPFCGGKACQVTIEEDGDPNFGGDVITCVECGASSHVEFGFKENLESTWNNRAAMLQPGNYPAIPEGYCIMPKKLTADNGAKGALSGEFHIPRNVTCHECGGEGCEDCSDQGSWEENITIGWDIIKLIYQAAVDACSITANPQPNKDNS